MNPSALVLKPFPPTVLAKIASFLAAYGVHDLKTWVIAALQLKDAALSEVSLSKLDMKNYFHYPWWGDEISWYYGLFQKCLRARNPYALYIHSLRLAFHNGDIFAVMMKVKCVRDVEWLASRMVYHITNVSPRRADTYKPRWTSSYFPQCWQIHNVGGELDGFRCIDCVYFHEGCKICRFT
ncbi:unnamed protein product [Arabis nemorensis]|uniref:Uncharacterized protein n=1 Tax=Arabis nemorensis TaxID=586526 RepID=A0A565AUW2_9BRAS|nr:unnamed protein product [Arabis nemorensis]